MTDEDKRRWAIEQAILMHGPNGLTTDAITTEAEKLLRFVDKAKDAAKPDA